MGPKNQAATRDNNQAATENNSLVKPLKKPVTAKMLINPSVIQSIIIML